MESVGLSSTLNMCRNIANGIEFGSFGYADLNL